MGVNEMKSFARRLMPKTYRWLGNAKRRIAAHVLAPNLAVSKPARQVLDGSRFVRFPKTALEALEVLLGSLPACSSNVPSSSFQEYLDPKFVVMLVISNLRIDPRVERSARALAGAGYRVLVIAPDFSSPSLREVPLDWGAGVSFDVLDASAGDYVLEDPFLFGADMVLAASKYRPFAFHCHDLNTAMVGFAAARKTGCRVVCDFHEWFSENVSWCEQTKSWVEHPERKKKIFKGAENYVLSHADEVITVCQSIADELAGQTKFVNRNICVIRNIPHLNRRDVQYPSLRQQLEVKDGQLIVLYQGGTGPTRLLEPVIESLVWFDSAVLVVRGPSLDLFGNEYRKLAVRCGVGDRFHLLPPVPSADVVPAAFGADIGIYTVNNLCKNFYYALPNKLFEYLAAGLPVACPDFPEVRRIVDQYDVGVTFDPYDSKSIAAAIGRLATPRDRKIKTDNIPAALRDINASAEWEKLVGLYDAMSAKAISSR